MNQGRIITRSRSQYLVRSNNVKKEKMLQVNVNKNKNKKPNKRFLIESSSSSSDENDYFRKIDIVFGQHFHITINTQTIQDIPKKQFHLVPQKTQMMLLNNQDEQQNSQQIIIHKNQTQSVILEIPLNINQILPNKNKKLINNQNPLKINKCVELNQYNSIQQIIITRRNNNSNVFSQQDIQRINDILPQQYGLEGQQNPRKFSLLKYIRKARANYQFKFCECPEKHIILYYYKSKVPANKQKAQLILEQYNKNKKMSANKIAEKIQQSGFRWSLMKSQIKKFIQNIQIFQVFGKFKEQIFKSHNFQINNYKTSEQKRKNKFNFLCCFDQSQYQKFQEIAILYLTSPYQNQLDKILKTPQLLSICQRNHNKKRYLSNFINKFKDFTIQKCDCKEKNIKLLYKNMLVPSISQKQTIIKYFIEKNRIRQDETNKKKIAQQIKLEGYNWKYLYSNLEVVLREIKNNKSLNSTKISQNIIQQLKIQPQIYHIKNDSQFEFQNSQLNTNSTSQLQYFDKQIHSLRLKSLTNTRNIKNIPFLLLQKFKRKQFIQIFQQQEFNQNILQQ